MASCCSKYATAARLLTRTEFKEVLAIPLIKAVIGVCFVGIYVSPQIRIRLPTIRHKAKLDCCLELIWTRPQKLKTMRMGWQGFPPPLCTYKL